MFRFTPLVVCLVGCADQHVPFDADVPWSVDPPAEPVPYGFWGLNGFLDADGLDDLGERFHMTTFSVANREPEFGTEDLLPMVRAVGQRANLRMAGGHEYYTDADGNFDLDRWKDMLDEWRGWGVQPFIDDGTLAHHMLIDDIDTFEGNDPTAAELDEMARYSREVFPGLPTLVRANATTLPVPDGGTYVHLDGCVNQYLATDGLVGEYAVAQREATLALGLDLVMGLNIADGGNGSSQKPGWRQDYWAMSAEEIVNYGTTLGSAPGTTMFLNWEYDGEEVWFDGSVGSDYFDEPDMQDALATLGEFLAGG